MSTASRSLASLGELATTRKKADGPDAPSKIQVDSMNFYYGNPFVEKTTGILHFYKKG